jgi:hypothetical protein
MGPDSVALFHTQAEAEKMAGDYDLNKPGCIPAAKHLGKAPELFEIPADESMFIVAHRSDFDGGGYDTEQLLTAKNAAESVAGMPLTITEDLVQLKITEHTLRQAAKTGSVNISRKFKTKLTKEKKRLYRRSFWNCSVEIKFAGTALQLLETQQRQAA